MTSNVTGVQDNREGVLPSSNKRENYIDWEEYYMAIAFLSGQRSKDPVTQVGACIVNEYKQIVGIGYNGFPNGCSDDMFPWTKDSSHPLGTKHLYVCHAEINAILNANGGSVRNCKMYVSLFPCNECAKAIIQCGIKTVIYVSDKHAEKTHTEAAKRMLKIAKVEYRQCVIKNPQIVIDFNEINKSDKSDTDA